MTARTRLDGNNRIMNVVGCDGPGCPWDMDQAPGLDWMMVVVIHMDGMGHDIRHYCSGPCHRKRITGAGPHDKTEGAKA